MNSLITPTDIPGVFVLTPRVFGDSRGFFLETYQRLRYGDAGVDVEFVQDNHSRSSRGVLRGLHYQLRNPQAKLIYVARGEVLDVAVDIRRGSPTFGRCVTCHLSDNNHRQIYVPTGFAHGFCVLSEQADVIYKCTDFYAPDDEYGVLWSDPALAISWPTQIEPMLSAKDAALRPLRDIPPEHLPLFR